jgi:hypothetical protein
LDAALNNALFKIMNSSPSKEVRRQGAKDWSNQQGQTAPSQRIIAKSSTSYFMA